MKLAGCFKTNVKRSKQIFLTLYLGLSSDSCWHICMCCS